MKHLVNLKMHRHAEMWKKQGNKICRFNFSLFSLPRTMILELLTESTLEEDELEEVKQNYDQINCSLDEMK